MNTKTELILVRHGETVWNATGRIQGQGDSPLTERGIAQAQAVARRLQHEPFTTLYASHLGRVIETARYIAALTGHAITIDERLQERAYGIFEGLTYEEAQVGTARFLPPIKSIAMKPTTHCLAPKACAA